MKPKVPRDGFTLLELVIAVAIIAVMAGAIVPLAYKEIESAREEATLDELAAIKHGCEEFFSDTGRLPTESEGLAALVNDPGVAGWSGPYVGGGRQDPLSEVASDSWSTDYIYDLNPRTNPNGAADLVVASAGSDGVFSLGGLGSTWTPAGDGDDLLALVSLGSLNRDKTRITEERLNDLAAAAREYYRDRAAFPATLSDLTTDYLDPGLDSQALQDGWNTSIELDQDGGTPPTLTISSYGPNRADNNGGGDDLTVQVSSRPPGRETTLERLEIAQTALNSDPGLVLTGNWATDSAALGLSAVYTVDGWGHSLAVNTVARVVYSPGPDNNQATTADNLPRGVGP
jgi:general secretion pathway protein G